MRASKESAKLNAFWWCKTHDDFRDWVLRKASGTNDAVCVLRDRCFTKLECIIDDVYDCMLMGIYKKDSEGFIYAIIRNCSYDWTHGKKVTIGCFDEGCCKDFADVYAGGTVSLDVAIDIADDDEHAEIGDGGVDNFEDMLDSIKVEYKNLVDAGTPEASTKLNRINKAYSAWESATTLCDEDRDAYKAVKDYGSEYRKEMKDRKAREAKQRYLDKHKDEKKS